LVGNFTVADGGEQCQAEGRARATQKWQIARIPFGVAWFCVC
jgi:hypothetical protein